MILERVPINNYIKDNLIGRQFGYLTVLYRTTNTISGRARWACQCDCGNIVAVATSDLKNGHTRSCGCLMKKINAEKQEIDETGNRYGKLTVLRKADKTKDRHTTWICKCDCGNEITTIGRLLRAGAVSSCGCMKISYGEYKIMRLLTDNHIYFIKEYIFPSCKFKDTNYPAKFDFYVDNKYIIEYDGQQHFTISSSSKWNTEQQVSKTQQHDKIKNQWCKKNNIPLIRIPYTHLKDLHIEDLLLETSQFIL